MRYAISSNEEIWVRLCSQFFREYGEYDWYEIPKHETLVFMLRHSNGQANPQDIERRIHQLYESAGIRD